ncbi:class I SAM-dependent methyltransferase [Paraflavitalea sp. CAU 1676]|uniref:spermine/spermidine synthase domain-containing protein n=1 Tax=Paraflavitalea sp. CAU 1676 TaxID=3032598 RepID=UPI0023DACCBA|nr:class I SAM-dependent methyltransferase [Paraflavitalea sp. CAU 1676]MDF2189044.1 class I SAM-dependent methyltransferase [Paraflavitalea sp. CAU 1676]
MRKPNHFAGIFLLSLATLLLELSLTRVMSVSLWYHFGFLVISTALLGFGTAGVVLACWRNLLEKANLDQALAWLSLLFGLVTIGSYWLLQQLPFNPFSIATDPRQWWIMLLYYIIIAAPFFVSGLALSLLFTRSSQHMSRLYAWDLAGAAMGCLLIAWVMPSLGGSGSVVMAAALGTTATFFFCSQNILRFSGLALFLLLATLATLADRWLPIKITENKRPATFKAKPILTQWNTFSFIELFERKADSATGNLALRRFMIDGGTAATGMVQLSPDVRSYLEAHPHDSVYETSAAYVQLNHPAVLNIGSGAGQEVLDALHHKARRVVSVEINPIINHTVKESMNEFWGNLFRQPGVELVTEEGRSYINRSRDQFDVILSSHTISNAAVASGALSLAENYVLTKEAFNAYYNHLSDTGVIFFSRPESQLPRLVTTAREVLADHDVADFSRHFYLYRLPPPKNQHNRSFVACFMMRKSPFTKEQIDLIDSQVLTRHTFTDSIWQPVQKLYAPYAGRIPNVYDTILTTPDLKAFYAGYAAQVAPATDDKPFFNQHARWSDIGIRTIRDVFSQDDPTAARLALENKPVAEVTLTIILVQSILLATILILFPLYRFNRSGVIFAGRWRYLGYFAMLGLGFIMIEISFIQRFTLYLGQPVYTLAVIIAGLLLFTGIGSWLTEKLAISPASLTKRWIPVLLAVLLLTSLLTPLLFNSTIHWLLGWRIALTLLLLAPLGILLGMPFPTGIKAVSYSSKSFIPWAWGVNGFFTVIGSVTALIAGMIAGFKVVILLAACCYLLAMVLLPKKASS